MKFILNLFVFFNVLTVQFSIAQCSISVEDVEVCSNQVVVLSPDLSVEVSDFINQYDVQDIPFEPFDISKSNDLEMGDDQVFGPYDIGFDFAFFNEIYSEFWISSNGFISFVESPETYNSTPLPNNAGPYAAIFGAWEDWNPGAGGDIFFASFPGHLVVQFLELNSYNCGNEPDTTGTFQIVLHKNTNLIDIHTSQKIECTNSVQGIQNSNGSYSAVVEDRNSSLWSAQNQSVRFMPLSAEYINWYDSSNQLVFSGCPLVLEVDFTQEFYAEFDDGDFCQSSDTFTINVSLPVPAIEINGSLLLCDIAGYQYQWYLNEEEVEGANSQFYSPNINGNYTVVAYNSTGCFETSESVLVDFTSIDSFGNDNNWKVYPLPSTGDVNLSFDIGGNVFIYDLNSRLLQTKKVRNESNLSLNLKEGLYFAKFVDLHNKVSIKKIVVQ
jgi:hypothetical protein